MAQSHYYPIIRELAEYEIWCNQGILRSAAQLTSEELHRPFPFGLGTAHKTLFHIVNVLRTWSACVEDESCKPKPLPYDAAASLPSIADLNAELSAGLLRKMDSADRFGKLAFDHRLQHVFHLVTHGTHHRTQIITMFRLMDKDPPFEAGDFGGWSRHDD